MYNIIIMKNLIIKKINLKYLSIMVLIFVIFVTYFSTINTNSQVIGNVKEATIIVKDLRESGLGYSRYNQNKGNIINFLWPHHKTDGSRYGFFALEFNGSGIESVTLTKSDDGNTGTFLVRYTGGADYNLKIFTSLISYLDEFETNNSEVDTILSNIEGHRGYPGYRPLINPPVLGTVTLEEGSTTEIGLKFATLAPKSFSTTVTSPSSRFLYCFTSSKNLDVLAATHSRSNIVTYIPCSFDSENRIFSVNAKDQHTQNNSASYLYVFVGKTSFINACPSGWVKTTFGVFPRTGERIDDSIRGGTGSDRFGLNGDAFHRELERRIDTSQGCRLLSSPTLRIGEEVSHKIFVSGYKSDSTGSNGDPDISFTDYTSTTNDASTRVRISPSDPNNDSLYLAYRISPEDQNCHSGSENVGTSVSSIPTGFTQVLFEGPNYYLPYVAEDKKLCAWTSDGHRGRVVSKYVPVDRESPVVSGGLEYAGPLETGNLIDSEEAITNVPIVSTSSLTITDNFDVDVATATGVEQSKKTYLDSDGTTRIPYSTITIEYVISDFSRNCSSENYSSALDHIPTPQDITRDVTNKKICARVQDSAGNVGGYAETLTPFNRDATTVVDRVAPTSTANIILKRDSVNDTGVSQTDKITNATSPMFTVSNIPSTDADGSNIITTITLVESNGTDVITSTLNRSRGNPSTENFKFVNPDGSDYVVVSNGRYSIDVSSSDAGGNLFKEKKLEDLVIDLIFPTEDKVPTFHADITSNEVSGVRIGLASTDFFANSDDTGILVIENDSYSDLGGRAVVATYALGDFDSSSACALGRRKFISQNKFNLLYLKTIDSEKYRVCRRYTDVAGNITDVVGGAGSAIAIQKDSTIAQSFSIDFSGNGRVDTTDAIVFYIYAIFEGIGFAPIDNQKILESVLREEVNFTIEGSPRLSDSAEDVYNLLESYSASNAIDFSGNGRTDTTDAIVFYIYAIFEGIGFAPIDNQKILDSVLREEVNFTIEGSPRLSDSAEDVYDLLESYSQ